MIYITGDTHGSFARIETFCGKMGTTKEDILIILGDAGINFSGGRHDRRKKEYLETLPITFFCIHGNHEQRPGTIETYKEKMWHGGSVYYEKEYPSLLFAKDGEVFDLNGRQTIVIGGAYSVDKMVRLINGYGWWPDEQPSDDIKQYVERQLDGLGWKVDVVLSHTTPLKYEPVEMFLSGLDQSKVDKSTEKWLDGIEKRLEYRKWYCGHYHTEKRIDRLEIMFENFAVFDAENQVNSSVLDEQQQAMSKVSDEMSDGAKEGRTLTISQIMEKMISCSNGNIHDIEHLTHVWTYAKTIGELEGLDRETQFILEAAAITHDIACPLCREKYGSADGKRQEEEGPALVRAFLKDTGMTPEQIERVAYLVGHHHTLHDIDGLDYQILIEADYIVNACEGGYDKETVGAFIDKFMRTGSGRRLARAIFQIA